MVSKSPDLAQKRNNKIEPISMEVVEKAIEKELIKKSM